MPKLALRVRERGASHAPAQLVVGHEALQRRGERRHVARRHEQAGLAVDAPLRRSRRSGVDTAGKPQAAACMRLCGTPSSPYEGSTAMSAHANHAGTSSWLPVKRTSLARPIAATRPSRCARRGPSPMTSSCQPGTRSRTRSTRRGDRRGPSSRAASRRSPPPAARRRRSCARAAARSSGRKRVKVDARAHRRDARGDRSRCRARAAS